MSSPFGEIIPAMELQANIINNLLTKSYYQIIPTWTNILILITGSLTLYLLIIKPVKTLKKDSYIPYFILLYAILTIVYIFSVFILLSNNFVLPIIFPLLTWLLSGIFSLFCFKYIEKIKKIKEKEIEIIILKKAEKEAILLQTKKILKRTAIDIHDGPLQRLKLLMDNIELEAEPELILNALEDVGMDIRNHLIEINNIADKLEINPILNQGLEVGF